MFLRKAFSFIAIYALIFSTFGFTVDAKEKKVKIRGYITKVVSPTSFEIDDLRIKKNAAVPVDFENQSPEVNFKPEDLRVGSAVVVEGMLDEETGELTATKITIDLEQYRKLKNTTVLTKTPAGIEKLEKGWKGVLWADGRRIRIEPETEVLFEPTKAEEKRAEAIAKTSEKKKEEEAEEEDEFAGSEPLKAISDVESGMFATYEGTEQADGTVLATRIVFMRNDLEQNELKLWDSLNVVEKPGDKDKGKSPKLEIDRVGDFKLLDDPEVQKYIRHLGKNLIPAHQRELPDEYLDKIPFRFYVVKEKDANAFATPNGIVVVTSGMIELLENEAQLASVISHEIAHSTQEHTWRQINKDKGKRRAMMIGAIAASLAGAGDLVYYAYLAMVNGYSRRLENQADRIGLEYMIAAGYDPREAPRVWKLMTKKYGDMPTNFFWSSHANHATRRSFLNVEIRNNYSSLDFDKLKKGDQAEYDRIVALIKEAKNKKK